MSQPSYDWRRLKQKARRLAPRGQLHGGEGGPKGFGRRYVGDDLVGVDRSAGLSLLTRGAPIDRESKSIFDTTYRRLGGR
jgi:hypothetical protein